MGNVVTVRDHTALQALTGELDTVRGFTESLHAQAHEAANRFATAELKTAQQFTDRVVGAVTEPFGATGPPNPPTARSGTVLGSLWSAKQCAATTAASTWRRAPARSSPSGSRWKRTQTSDQRTRGGGRPGSCREIQRDLAAIHAAISLGVVHYLLKPFAFTEMRDTLERYAQFWQRVPRFGEVFGQADVDDIWHRLRSIGHLDPAQGDERRNAAGDH
jgi:hypothetical protein